MMRAVNVGEARDFQAMSQQVCKANELHAVWMNVVKRREDKMF
jgi:hypothetical protein